MSQIIADEQLNVQRVLLPIQRWTTALRITSLRPGTVIKDDVIPNLLAQEKQPTFVTMNIKDFWEPTLRDKRYCIVCMDVPDERQSEIPGLLRRLFRLPMFKTKANRMGKVVKVNNAGVQYYQLGDEELHSFTVSQR
ncbi:hypothetical protein H8E77_27505 [bacterium]|nr:hypothetical protein [bacterium]